MEVSGVGLVCLGGLCGCGICHLCQGIWRVGEEGGGDGFWSRLRVGSEF